MPASVAGVYAPAFVERAFYTVSDYGRHHSVAGVYAPAFVERGGFRTLTASTRVSPEFMLRPSLSVSNAHREATINGVSPEFMLRPSLSVLWCLRSVARRPRVAGVYAPAFVKRRPTCCRRASWRPSVAGVYAPAFVERFRLSGSTTMLPECRRSLCSGLR